MSYLFKPETILLLDKDTDKYIECEYCNVATHKEAWVGQAIVPKIGKVAVVVYEDGTIFTSSDWQTEVEDEILEDLEEARYVITWIENETGCTAVLLNGLPRVIK